MKGEPMGYDDEALFGGPKAHTADELRQAAQGLAGVLRPFTFNVRAKDGTVACGQCGDSKLVEVDDRPGYVTVRPCAVCDPERYARWAGGHYDTGHDARDCDACKAAFAEARHR